MFSSSLSEVVLREMENAGFPVTEENARICLAILKLSEGDYEKFKMALDLATRDWRNVLVAAGLANENWERKIQEGFI